MMEVQAHSPLKERMSGILLHPTSLPGPWGNGDLGREAYHFVDFLAAAGQKVWQILPIGPTHGDGSPYQSLSVHAGNPALIGIDALVDEGWLDAREARPEEHPPSERRKERLITHAYRNFNARADEGLRAALDHFSTENAFWLDDYCLFRVIKAVHQEQGWTDWPHELRDHCREALDAFSREHAQALSLVRFEQFLFFRQWCNLKKYANDRGILIFGDMPIFVAHDSADVWAQRQCFLLDDEGRATVVAGVPPDYFSETGQRWGNPHYDWDWMESDDFAWWHARMESALKLFDLVRIDHFRGFQAYWEIPAFEETAVNGRWVEVPGDALFAHFRKHMDPLPVVAEDLGIITKEVDALREKYALPGMKVLQFAFEGGATNPYLPHNHEVNSVVYTGTHDNDTTLGWYAVQSDELRRNMAEYLGEPAEAMPWPLIRAAYASVARLAVVPMQDVLELDSEHRMNRPGTTEGNWIWRFDWGMVDEGLSERLSRLVALYGR